MSKKPRTFWPLGPVVLAITFVGNALAAWIRFDSLHGSHERGCCLEPKKLSGWRVERTGRADHAAGASTGPLSTIRVHSPMTTRLGLANGALATAVIDSLVAGGFIHGWFGDRSDPFRSKETRFWVDNFEGRCDNRKNLLYCLQSYGTNLMLYCGWSINEVRELARRCGVATIQYAERRTQGDTAPRSVRREGYALICCPGARRASGRARAARACRDRGRLCRGALLLPGLVSAYSAQEGRILAALGSGAGAGCEWPLQCQRRVDR